MLATLSTLALICTPLSAPGLTMPDVVAPVEAEVVVERSYGGQIIAMDAAGLALLVAGAASENGAIAGAGALTMAFGPGVVHASHDRGGAAVASMLMRPSLVYGGMALGFATASCDSNGDSLFCGLGEAFIGGLVGYGVAVVVDSAYLAREKRTVRTPSWSPTVAASPAGVQVGVGGSF